MLVGYLIGKLSLPDYAHKFSPKTYTQPQLFACLVLKEFLRRDYRGIEELLKDTPELAGVVELKQVPDHSTLQKAAERLLRADFACRLLDMTVRLGKFVGKLEPMVPLAAMDGTGLESHHASAYYVRRKAKGRDFKQSMTYKHFPKAGIVSDCRSHLILSIVPERGPGSDAGHFQRAFDQACRRIRIATLAADAGYDGEHIHVYARQPRRADFDPATHRPTNRQTAERLLATHDETRPAAISLRPALAIGNNQQHAQATAWFSASRPHLLVSMPRNRIARLDPQYHDSQTTAGFRQSKSESLGPLAGTATGEVAASCWQTDGYVGERLGSDANIRPVLWAGRR